jgi:hypothetical protein
MELVARRKTFMLVCDGCGLEAPDLHRRQRIERLELATRYRPIHIQVLFVDSAPGPRNDDYFYRSSKDRAARSVGSRMYFDEIMKVLAAPAAASGSKPLADEAAQLAEFQRRGYFLTHVVECPIEGEAEMENAIYRMAPKFLLRVQKSYQPKHILLLSQPTQHIIELLQTEGWDGKKLLLDDEVPFFDPFLGDPQNQAEFGTALGDRLAKAVSGLF